jgi:hypothetical protein
LLAFRVPVFTRRARREPSAHPKLYLFDAGVFRSLRPRGPLDRPEEIEGAALEGLVAQHLRAWRAYRPGDAGLFFWLYRGKVRERRGRVWILPVQEFLQNLHPHSGLLT